MDFAFERRLGYHNLVWDSGRSGLQGAFTVTLDNNCPSVIISYLYWSILHPPLYDVFITCGSTKRTSGAQFSDSSWGKNSGIVKLGARVYPDIATSRKMWNHTHIRLTVPQSTHIAYIKGFGNFSPFRLLVTYFRASRHSPFR